MGGLSARRTGTALALVFVERIVRQSGPDYLEERSAGGGGREVYSIFMHGRSRMVIAVRPSHPYNGGTEHVGFSPARQALLAPSAKRREVFDGLHKG